MKVGSKKKVCHKKHLKLKGNSSEGFFAFASFQCPNAKKPLPIHGISDGKKIVPYSLRLPKTAPLALVCVWGQDRESEVRCCLEDG